MSPSEKNAAAEPADAGREIQSASVVGSDNEVLAQLTVLCAVTDRSVSLQECLACAECEGLQVSSENGSTLLVCRARDDDEARRRALVDRWAAGELAGAANVTPISVVMTRELTCVPPDQDLSSTADLMLERGISGIPVVDAARKPLGLVSKTDLLRALRQARSPNELTVGDIMAPMPFALPKGQSIARAAALMAFEGVHRLLAVSPNGAVVGIVSSIDILRWLAREHGFVLSG